MVQINDINNKILKNDKKISIAVMSSFAILAMQYFILYYFNLAGTHIEYSIQLLSKSIVGLLFLIALPIVLKRNWLLFLCTYTISVGIFLFNYLIFRQNIEHLNSIIFPFFFTCLPCFIYSYSIYDRMVFINIIKKVSSIVFNIGTLLGIFVFTKRIYIGSYSMSLSYYMLLPAIVNLNNFFNFKSLKSLIIASISIIIILALGARGPIMCIGIFGILYLISSRPKLNYKFLLLFLTVLFIFIVIITNLNNIILKMYNFLNSYGINSRTLLLFMGDNLYLSGRDNLYSEIIYQIMENPIFGIGITGDRLHIGTYTHNIFIEILSGFGIIIGSFIIIALLFICYRSIKLNNKYDSNFIIVWLSIGLVPLFISGSYLVDFRFWIFLGVSLRNFKVNNC